MRPGVQTVVAPNVDTAYSVGQLDLSGGPQVIDVPDTAGRYYVLQLLDLYSNTIDYIGRRTTGTGADSFVIVPPGYRGPLPAGVPRIKSPTDTVWLLGRTLVQDEADLAAVVPLLRGYTVTPLARWEAAGRQPSLLLPDFPDRLPRLEIPAGVAFYDELGLLLANQPPPRGDGCALRAFGRAGIGPGRTPSTEARGAVRTALAEAPRAGARLLSGALRRVNAYSSRRKNGWLALGPYVGDYGRNYLGRAVVARTLLGALTVEENVYLYGFGRQPRPAPQRPPPLPVAVCARRAASGGRLLVAHDVQPRELPVREPDRPLRHRRPHPRPAARSGRIAHALPSAPGAAPAPRGPTGSPRRGADFG